MKLTFVVLGDPQGKGRPRAFRTGDTIRTYTPEKTVVYENLVRMEFARQCGNAKLPDDALLDMHIKAFHAIPKSTTKKKRGLMLSGEIRPSKKPDMDNILKVIADSLNNVAYRDDSQIADAMIQKFYSDNPRVEVTIQTIGGN